MSYSVRIFFLLFAFGNLALGIISGLGRLGWEIPLPELYIHHGVIMVGGFLGSLIALEKIVPLRKPIFLFGPLLSAASIILFVFGNFYTAVVMIIMASMVLTAVYLVYIRIHYSFYLILALLGSVCWLIGNVLLLNHRFYPLVFPWWMGFLLFTIVSERLELMKFLPVSQTNRSYLIAYILLFLVGIVLPFHTIGTYITGISLILTGVWMLRHDVVRFSIKKKGLTKFTGTALLCGYVALIMAGIFLLLVKNTAFGYDIIVHTFFLGFTFSMIFAHGPIILPGVLGLSVKPFHPFMYLPLVVLYVSLLMRIAADSMLMPYSFRQISGWISSAGILLYFVALLSTTIRLLHAKKTD